MLYCPKCKNEYQDGYTVCADCNVMLIEYDELNPKLPIYFGDEEEIKVLEEYLKANFIKSCEVKETEKEGILEIYVDDKEKKNAVKLLKVYLHDKDVKQMQDAIRILEKMNKEAEEDDEEASLDDLENFEGIEPNDAKQILSDMQAIHKMYEPAKVHENSKEKAQEYKSTAIMLIIMGLLGIGFDAFMYLDKLPIHFYGSSKYLSCGLMLALFLIFVGFGISSLKSSKVLAVKGEEEGNLEDSIKEWMKENLTAQSIDSELEFYDNDDESVKFFNRTELMKSMVLDQFDELEAEDGLLDELIDKFYEEIYNE